MADSIDDGLVPSTGPGQTCLRRTCGDIMLCGVTLAELSLLVFLTPTFTALDWIYVLQHVMVFGVALTRHPPRAQDHSWQATLACLVSYAYPYTQILYLGIVPGAPAGLGVREAALLTMLGPMIGMGPVAALAILHRLITAVVDGAAALAGYAWLASATLPKK